MELKLPDNEFFTPEYFRTFMELKLTFAASSLLKGTF